MAHFSNFDDLEYIQFGIYSAEELLQMSTCEVYITKLSGPHSVYDERMGILEHGKTCPTCGLANKDCVGHFGHIQLNYDVLHPLYFKHILHFLKSFCYQCYNMLLTRDQLELNQLLRFPHPTRFEKILDKMDRVDVCPHCDSNQPRYIFTSQERFVYMVFKIDGEMTKIQMTESEIRTMFSRISDDDLILLGFDPCVFHPRNLVLTVLPVLPPVARPFVLADEMTCDDDLTIQYLEIIKANNSLKDVANLKETKKQKLIQSLKFRIRSLFDNSHDKARLSNGRPLKGIKKRLTGKEGLIRNNLMGKRVDKSARTVIGPDPTLCVDEIAIPEEIANTLCYPVRVNTYNKTQIQHWIHQQKANFILRQDGQVRINLKYASQKAGTRLFYGDYVIKPNGCWIHIEKESQLQILRKGDQIWRNHCRLENVVYPENKHVELQIGDIVERKLQDGDILLLNRQPTLHKGSMIAQKVRIRKGKTIRMNLAVCKSFNADFDGDEMNLHCPSNVETETELRLLSSLSQNIINIQSSKPNINIVQDALLGIFLMTRYDEEIPQSVAFQITMSLSKWSIETWHIKWKLYQKLVPSAKLNGKFLFSLLLPPSLYYEQTNQAHPAQPTVYIQQGILIQGAITKANVGTSNSSLITVFFHQYGVEKTLTFLDNVQFMANAFLSWHSFTVGLGDCKVTRQHEIENHITRSFVKATAIEESTTDNRLKEAYICHALGGARDHGMAIAKNAMTNDNHFISTVVSGSKGDYFNIAQITGLLGQQNLNGQRIPPMLTRNTRTLPHYPLQSNQMTEEMKYESRGFIHSSFAQGLSPREFMFHAMTGREGITDTAMKSVTWDTRIVFYKKQQLYSMPIGKWIDACLEKYSHQVQHYSDRHMEFLSIKNVYIPTTDEKGNIQWGQITAMTRHDPGSILYKIQTKSGRQVTVTESKSLIIWNTQTNSFHEQNMENVCVGDLVPVTLFLPCISQPSTFFTPMNCVLIGQFLRDRDLSRWTHSPIHIQKWLAQIDRMILHLLVLPSDCILSVLSGLFTEKSISSFEQSFIDGVAMLCSRVGIFGDISYSKTTITFTLSCPNLIKNNVVLDPIVSITTIPNPTQKVYDLTVPNTLNFSLANGLHVRDTATSGYIQRRMIKIAEDYQIKYDGTVRNSSNKQILQFSYGENGLDPIHTIFYKNEPSFVDADRLVHQLNHEFEQV